MSDSKDDTASLVQTEQNGQNPHGETFLNLYLIYQGKAQGEHFHRTLSNEERLKLQQNGQDPHSEGTLERSIQSNQLSHADNPGHSTTKKKGPRR